METPHSKAAARPRPASRRPQRTQARQHRDAPAPPRRRSAPDRVAAAILVFSGS